MEQLKKIGAIGGAISLALCWPLAVGQIGQNVVTDGVASIDNSSVKAELVEFDRGYLSSSVKTRFTVMDETLKEQLEIDGLPTEFVVNSEIGHGLISLNAVSTLEGLEALPLTLTTKTQLNGNTDFNFELSQLNHQSLNEEGVSISVTKSSLTGHATVLGQINYELSIPSIQVDFESGEEVVFTSLKGSGEGKQANGYWLGNQVFSMDSFLVTDAMTEPYLAIDNSTYKFESELDETTKRLRSNMMLDIATMKSTDGEVNNLNVDFELSKLDSESFENIFSVYQDAPVMTEQDIESIVPYIDILFSKGFDLSMNNMSMNLGAGEFESKWLVSVPEGTDNVSQDPATILPALEGSLDTYFSDELVDEYPFIKEGIDELLVMEMITKTTKGYEIKAQLEKGNLVFENGQQVPLLALMMPMLLQ
ncbi:DUF945 family protein [Vibrio sp. T187]|uniref:DUF945 family protein n=1 Tax=Vibrio TaxID=662 RepID=UPI0010CA0257|nr:MULTISPECIES: DUF945 family protein [Vibrio]MBW3696797.1 DUF945 family protein [Vibrio sp. T187]